MMKEASLEERKIRTLKLRALLWGLIFAVLTGLLLAIAFPQERLTLEEGDVSPRDIRAPRRVAYVSRILTEEAMAQAEKSVPEVYDPPDARIARQQLKRARAVLAYIDAVRQDGYATTEQRVEWIEAVEDLRLSQGMAEKILGLSEEEWQAVVTETLRLLDQVMREEIREADLEKVRRLVPALVSLEFSDVQAQVTSELVQSFVRPNSFLNVEKTEEKRRQARQQVELVRRTLEKGEIILREGDIVTALDLEALEALGMRQTEARWVDIAGALLLDAALVCILGLYVSRFHFHLLADVPKTAFLFLLLSAFIALAKAMVPRHVVLPYLYPVPALAMLVSVLVGPQLAVVVTVMLGLVVGFLSNGYVEPALYAITGGIIAALLLRHVVRLNAFLIAGLCVALVNMAMVLAFRLPQGNYDLAGLLTLMEASVANGGLSASIALVGYFLAGSLFDVITPLRLMELSRPTQPLLRQLLLKAPGTYHHSLMVGNMAEEAAGRIGADPLLARVGAYYHDIGKTLRPYFFVENQVDGINVHERLDPYTSAQIIIGHVRDGLDLAHKYRLPRRLRDFIAQHHGTGLARYFYRQAQEQAEEGEEVREEDFRYPGPKPQSKEAAIVMLADACEARVRAERPSSPEELDRLVRQVIEEGLEDGQLDECDLSMRDLSQIREAFVHILQGVFHPRVQYPEEKGT